MPDNVADNLADWDARYRDWLIGMGLLTPRHPRALQRPMMRSCERYLIIDPQEPDVIPAPATSPKRG